MPTTCNGCGVALAMNMPWIARKEVSLPDICHNDVRDTLGDLSSIVYKNIIREPVIQEACEVAGEPSLIADLGVRGISGSSTF